MGFNWAWQSVMCRNDTLPNFGMSYSCPAAVAASAPVERPRAIPHTEAAPSTCRNSRLVRFTVCLLVHRRLRIQQQRDDVLDLLFVQDARVARARHVRAGVVGLGVPDLAPGVLDDRSGGGAVGVRHAAQLAVLVEAGADG